MFKVHTTNRLHFSASFSASSSRGLSPAVSLSLSLGLLHLSLFFSHSARVPDFKCSAAVAPGRCVRACVCACVCVLCACVRVCARARACVCVRVYGYLCYSYYSLHHHAAYI